VIEPKAKYRDGNDRRSTPPPLQYLIDRLL
jgi:hypothetical protein